MIFQILYIYVREVDMVLNINMEIEARMHEMYKSMVNTPKPTEAKENVSPEDFWNTMKIVSLNKQAQINYHNNKSV